MAQVNDMVGAVLVIGGGIAGVQASLDLAESGFRVYLLEEKPCIGGVMAQLDKTFPTNDCSACIFSPKLQTLAQNPNIEILAYSKLEGIEGEAGSFRAKIRKKARYVDAEKCTSCGTCAGKCPIKVRNEYNFGHDVRKAIYKDYAQGIPSVYTIDTEHCRTFQGKKCGVCNKVCPAGAIDYEQKDVIQEIEVGAAILTTGYELFDVARISEFGYGRMPNVVTNLEMERILSASGPFEGQIKRPSDGVHPHKVAWIQCVGSRDPRKGMPHCSSVCCMASIKEAVIAREHDSSIEPTIFFMDIRAYGKDFDKYYERAQKEGGVRFIRSMVSRLVEDPITRDLSITYLDEQNRLITETFNMVVLAAGIKPKASTIETAGILNVDLDSLNFCETNTFQPVHTSTPGIFVAGAFQAPKDIPQSVMEASASAGAAMRMLTSQRNTLTKKKQLPPEKDFTGQEARIGVFVCRCGINIAQTVNVPELVEKLISVPGVAYAGENLFTCSQDTQQQIKKIIQEYDLNRVIVASCTPRTHLPLFQETAREAGLNKYLVEMANIREHCSWVHMQEKEKATKKAFDLIKMAVARGRQLEQVEDQQLPMVQSALVVGGGVAGMAAALNIASQGFKVDLVEAADKLGGNALRLFHTIKGEQVRPFVEDLVGKVTAHNDINVHLKSRIEEVQGFIGNFKTRVADDSSEPVEIEHGVAVIATGAHEWKPDIYGYGSDPRIRTHLEMSEALKAQDPAVMRTDTTVFIQCVGSRCEERPWCSKVCCNHTVQDAIAIKEANPATNIYVLYRDIRTFGLNEPYYEKARRIGRNIYPV